MKNNIASEEYLSDSDILEKIHKQEIQMTEALEDTFNGTVNPLFIKGPPGCGKSEGVKIASRAAGIESIDIIGSTWSAPPEDELKAGRPAYPYDCTKVQMENGALMRSADYSKWALAADLYANRHGGVICIDDNDSILRDMDAAAMIMAATEKNAETYVSYPKASSTHELQLRGVEPKFKCQTRIIILTNIDMKAEVMAYNNSSGGKRSKNDYVQRWAALMSRGTYVDLQMNSPRSIRVYCEDKIDRVGMLINSAYLNDRVGRSLTAAEAKVAMKWIRENQSRLSMPLDLRTYIKLAEIIITRNATWQISAEARFLVL